MGDVLVVLNPREIPVCLASYEALDIDKVYLKGFWEPQLAQAALEVSEYDRYIVVSDDCIVEQKALDAVLRYLGNHPVVTGYCSLDSRQFKRWVNLSYKPIHDPVPRIENYDFMEYAEVVASPEPLIQTGFVGMALTGMTKDIWQRFPFDVCEPYKAQCDYSLSYRLTQAGIPMWAARDGYVVHVKETWNQPDQAPEKRLLLGQVEPEVRHVPRSTAWDFKPVSEVVAEVGSWRSP